MIITKTPLRLEFLGGSTDIANFYTRALGKVFNATLDKYIYVIVNKRFDNTIKIVVDNMQVTEAASMIQHKYTKEALRMFGIKSGIEVVSISDIHTNGSGLGSSSSFTVGLINALAAFAGKKLGKRELAEMACHLEIDILKEPIGKQDQFAAAFGGFSDMTFNNNGYVDVKEVKLTKNIRADLEKHLVVFYTGITRSTTNLLGDQHRNFDKTFPLLKEMAALVSGSIEALEKGALPEFANFLYREWTVKKRLMPGITTDKIEEMYEKAVKAGAWGGRVSGAGGGGFLYVLAPVAKHSSIEKALSGHKKAEFKFTQEGSKVIYS